MRIVLIAALVVVMGACATTKGPNPIITAAGSQVEYGPGNLAKKFNRSEIKAAGTVDVPGTEQQALDMFEDGTTLIYANCSDFFRNAGRNQTRLMFWKDAIGVLGTLAAGIIALDGSGTGDLDRLAVISLGSSTALSGIDIYTQRFLFAAENVDAVRELTLNALAAHTAKVNENPPKSYQAVSRHLLDNQALCFPPRIAMLARDAIKNGDVVAYTTGAGPEPALAATNDLIVYKDIGDQLGLPGPLTAKQAAGYYWLVVVGADADEQGQKIQPMLAGIPTANNPFEDGKTDLKAVVPQRDFIRSKLSRLSPQSVKGLTDLINAEKGKAGASVPAIETARVKIEVV